MRSHLLPADPELGDGAFGLPADPDASLVHLLSVPFEATVSYGQGTADGPEAIREASHQVDLFDGDFGRPYRHGIFWHQSPELIRSLSDQAREAAAPIIECVGEIGDDPELHEELAFVNQCGAQVNRWLQDQVSSLLDQGRIVGTIGGDHSIPFAAIQAHAQRRPGMGILHFDAHADLREAYEGFEWSHASIMHNVMTRIPEVQRLVQVGIRDYCEEELRAIRQSKGRITTYFDRDFQALKHAGVGLEERARKIIEPLPKDVYISLDIDGLDPSLCPNTGTPVPGGIDFQELCTILQALCRSGRRILGFDLVEVSQGADSAGSWDANVGARVLYKLIGATLSTRELALSPKQA